MHTQSRQIVKDWLHTGMNFVAWFDDNRERFVTLGEQVGEIMFEVYQMVEAVKVLQPRKGRNLVNSDVLEEAQGLIDEINTERGWN